MALMPVQFAAVLCCTAVQALTVSVLPLRWIDAVNALVRPSSVYIRRRTVEPFFFLSSPSRNPNSRMQTAPLPSSLIAQFALPISLFPVPKPLIDRGEKPLKGDPPKTDRQDEDEEEEKASARWRNDLQASPDTPCSTRYIVATVGGLQENTRPEPHSTLDDEQGRADTRPGLNPCPDGPWRTIFLRIAGSACGGGRSLFLLRL